MNERSTRLLKQLKVHGATAFPVLAAAGALLCTPLLGQSEIAWAKMNLHLQSAVLLVAAAYFWHACLSRTLANAARLLAVSFTVSYSGELIGMNWSGLFGSRYRYNPDLTPLLPGNVPVCIPLVWFILAHTAAVFLLPAFPATPGKSLCKSLLVKTVLCALCLVGFDAFLDPLAVALQLWTWFEPGNYFGTPWRNFLGWFAVSVTIFAAYFAVEKKQCPNGRNAPPKIDLKFARLSIVLTLLCLAACWIKTGTPAPALLSLLILGPVWSFPFRRRSTQHPDRLFAAGSTTL